MTNKLYTLFQYAYLFIAAFFAYEAINTWNEDRTRAYLFIFLVAVAIFMFFFKRNFRKRIEEKNKK